MNTFQDIIQYLLWNNICTIEEIAGAMYVTPPTVYGYKNQGTEPKFSQILALNKWLAKVKGCYIIQNVFHEAPRPDWGDRPTEERLEIIATEANAIKNELITCWNHK